MIAEVLFQQYVEQGWVKCTECGKVDLSDCKNIVEARKVWNNHVQEQH